jgi:SSS family solute:Na+ symporter
MIPALSLIYAALLLGIGFFHRTDKSADSYFVLGRTLTFPAFVASLVSTWYGGILGVGEFTYRFGISNWLVFGVPYYIAALIFALFIAGRARRTKYYTIPDLLHRRFGRKVALVSAVIIFFMTVPGAYVLMLGMLVHTVFGYSIATGVVVGTIFSVVYVYRGGLRSVVRTDLFQFALMYAAFLAAVVYLFVHFGGPGEILGRLPRSHLSWNGGNSPQYVLVWYVIAMATLVEPAFYQRCFAADSEKTARRGILVSILFWITFDAMTTTAGLYARVLLPGLANPALAFPALAVDILPTVLGAFFVLGLLATVMSTIDSYAFISAVTLGRDIYWRMKNERDDRSRNYSAWGLVVTGLVAVSFALAFESVVDIWHHFGSVGTPALLFPLAASLSGRKLMRSGQAMAVMLAGGGLSLFWLLSPRFFPGLGGRYLLGLEPIFPGMIVSGALFLLFALGWSRREEARQVQD